MLLFARRFLKCVKITLMLCYTQVDSARRIASSDRAKKFWIESEINRFIVETLNRPDINFESPRREYIT